MNAVINVKRIYDGYDPADGFRILVDRLWPRGVSKEKAHLDLWAKDIAPTDKTREAFHHEDDKWAQFKKEYTAELEKNSEAVQDLLSAIRGKKKVTLLFGAKNVQHNQAVVLKAFLERGKPRH
ncbi:MAG: DUF488 family protein [Kiritimatiellales bacterium]